MTWHCKDCKKRHIGCRKDCESWAADCAAAAAEKKRIREQFGADALTRAYFKQTYKRRRPNRRTYGGWEK